MSDLQRLFDNELDCIALDDFFTAEQCSDFLGALRKSPEWIEANIDRIEKRVFPDMPNPAQLFFSQYAVITLGMDEQQYVELCKTYNAIWQRLVDGCGYNPFKILVDYIKNNYGIAVQPAEKNNLSYSPIVVRDLSMEVLPHADFGPFDGKDWEISQVVKQIAWNIYFTDPIEGGETIVYDYLWENDLPIDDGSYGIADLDQPTKVKFSVAPGKLVLFNCRNFHMVTKSAAPRIAIGGLFGLTKDGKVIAWS